MANSISLEVVTPDGVALDQSVEELTAPGVQGEFGVLPGHRPLLAGLRTGILRFRVEGEEQAVAIGPGFAKVAHGSVKVLTDKCMSKEALDPIVARKDLREAEEELSSLAEDAESSVKAELIARARWAAVRLELYGDPPPATIMLEHEIRLLGHEDYAQTLNQVDKDEDASASSL